MAPVERVPRYCTFSRGRSSEDLRTSSRLKGGALSEGMTMAICLYELRPLSHVFMFPRDSTPRKKVIVSSIEEADSLSQAWVMVATE